MNNVILRGHLGAEPRNNTTTTNGIPVCNFRMATNRKWNDAQGVKQERTEWHNVVCWNKLALTVGQNMHKGSQVLVDGRLETRQYDIQHVDPTSKQPVFYANGQPMMITRYVTEIVARSVDFLDKKPAASAYAPGAGQPVVVAGTPNGAPFVMNGAVVGTTVAQPGAVAGQPVVVGDPAAVAAAFVQPGTVQPGQPATMAGVVDQPVIIPGV